jgi:molybdate transport system ATP-binding protein
MTAEPLVSISGLNVRVSASRQLRIAAFSVYQGQHWCVFGGNGSGKTLLAAAVKGEQLLARPRISWAAGFDPQRDIQVVSFEAQQRLLQADARHDISEYSANAIDQGTTVAELVAGTDADAAGCMEVLCCLGINELAQRGIRYLSSGQLRRAMIARAFQQRPQLLILDEPLESIDVDSADAISRVLCDYMSVGNATLLLARSHRDILPGVTHLAVMDDLILRASGPISSMQRDSLLLAVAGRAPVLPAKLPELPAASVGVRSAIVPEPSQPLIRLQGVNVSYGDKVVFENLHWQMNWGEHVHIAGPNGCGKSTLLGLLDGDNHKAYGQPVYLFGRRRGTGESVWDIKAHFGVVSNELHNKYLKGWRVVDVVVSGFFDSMGLYQHSGQLHLNIAREWLAVVAMQDSERSWYHELSFGQQRLVLLARAMVKQPLILVLDEPCTGLDDYHRQMILALLDLIVQAKRTHLLYVSHTEGEAPAGITHKFQFSIQTAHKSI